MNDSSLFCWGSNHDNQLGLGFGGYVGGQSPVELGSVPAPTEQIVDVCVGLSITCILTRIGQIKCVGSELLSARLGYPGTWQVWDFSGDYIQMPSWAEGKDVKKISCGGMNNW